MPTLRITLVIAILATCANFAVASPSMTSGAKPDQPLYRWRAGVIRLMISNSLAKSNSNIKSDSDVAGALRRSIEAWQDAAGIEFQIEFTDKQTVSPSGVAGDGVSIITIAQTPENVLFFAKDAQTVSAKTRVFYNRKGAITEADVVLNPFQQFSTDGSFGTFDLQSVLTHEIGHLLGLRHSSVIGAVMFDHLGKNGVNDQVQFTSRGLSDSDIASVREMYGTPDEFDDCCSAIAGKIIATNARLTKNIKVWAEDAETGRVAAQTEMASDGTYRLGGLANGKYQLRWRTKTASSAVATGDLGSVEIDGRDAVNGNQKIALEPARLSLDLIGVDGHLAESAVNVKPGTTRTILIGGRGMTAADIELSFSSKFFHVDPLSIVERDFGDQVSVVSFVLTIDEDAKTGAYSIFASAANGGKTSLIGALRVE